MLASMEVIVVAEQLLLLIEVLQVHSRLHAHQLRCSVCCVVVLLLVVARDTELLVKSQMPGKMWEIASTSFKNRSINGR